MPVASQEILRQLDWATPIRELSFEQLGQLATAPVGQTVTEAKPVFPRLEKEGKTPRLEKPKPEAKPAPKEAAPVAPVGLITIQDFQQVQLRTAKVLSAERVEGADKLLKLQIEVGEPEPRQLVAGIAQHYAPEALVGRTIIIVANLEPATIRGVTSQGMLLAASSGDSVKLLMVDGDLPPGSKIR